MLRLPAPILFAFRDADFAARLRLIYAICLTFVLLRAPPPC